MYFVILVIFTFLYEINFNFKTVTPPNTPSLTKLTKEQRTCQLSTPLRFASLSLRVELSSCDGSITLSYRWHGTAPSRLIRCIAAHDILLLPTPNANKTVRLFAFNDCTTAQPTKCSSSDVHVGVHTRNRRPAGVYA